MKAIEIVLKHFDGHQSRAASSLDVKQGHISYWLKEGKDMPLHLIPKAAKIIGKKPSELKPDFEWY